jgi:hypothetical protein
MRGYMTCCFRWEDRPRESRDLLDYEDDEWDESCTGIGADVRAGSLLKGRVAVCILCWRSYVLENRTPHGSIWPLAYPPLDTG